MSRKFEGLSSSLIDFVQTDPRSTSSAFSHQGSRGWKPLGGRILFCLSGLKDPIALSVLNLFPVKFRDPTLESAYFQYIAPTFVSRARMCGTVGKRSLVFRVSVLILTGILWCAVFWFIIGLSMGSGKLPSINDYQEIGFHLNQGFTMAISIVILGLPNLPYLKRHIEIWIYILFGLVSQTNYDNNIPLQVFTVFGIWASVTATTADFTVDGLEPTEMLLLLADGIKFKMWSDILALFQYTSAVVCIDLLFQSRSEFF